MKILIVGGGKVGSQLCQQLLDEGHDIVVIDKEAKNVNYLVDTYDVTGIVGNGIVSKTQIDAGVKSCDVFISCTPMDEVNILCSTVAKKLGAKHTVARVRDPEYFNTFDSDELGLDLLVNPEHEAAQEIGRILNYQFATHVEDFVGGNIRLLEYKIPEGSEIDGLTLRDIPSLFDTKVLICAVIRGEETLIPQGNFELCVGDRIFVTAEASKLQKFFRKINVTKSKSKKVFILGGVRVGFYLAERLNKSGAEVTVFEKDAEICKKFYEQFNKISVLNVDGFQQHILEEEGVDGVDAVVALSDNDEKNVLISMFVHNVCGKKAIVKIDKTEYLSMLEKGGIDSVVMPKMLTANQIVRFVRNLDSGNRGGSVSGLYRMLGSDFEFLEFVANDGFLGNNIALKDLKLKPSTIVVSIVKNKQVFVAQGSDKINSGDTVLVATKECGVDELNDILA